MPPLLSIVIPTHRRPRLVARAIASALDTYKSVDIEILVVPNGQDDTWQAVANRHAHDPRIQWLYLPTGNACAARNHGLANAQGRYLRFLDDDDYLLPAAAEQLHLIDSKDLDACSAPLESTNADGSVREIVALPATDDMVIAAMCSIGVNLTEGSIFRTALIQQARWRESVVLYDDYLWMLDLATMCDVKWTQTSIPIGAYVQHDGARLSRIRRSGRSSRTLVNALFEMYRQLQFQGRLTSERAEAVATALLTHAHSAFPASPFFLGAAIQRAKTIVPDSTPLQSIFKRHPWLARHLLLIEWAALAPRYVTRGYRRASWLLGSMLNR